MSNKFEFIKVKVLHLQCSQHQGLVSKTWQFKEKIDKITPKTGEQFSS